jgi:hypothetical protein
MSSYTPAPLVPKGSKTGSASKPSGPTTKSYGSVTHYTLQEAQGFALKAFQDAIGRAPSAEELQNFLASFNAGQRSQTSTVTSGAGGSFTTTSGGVDNAMLAQQIAQQNPEFVDYQKATTYFDTFNQVMNSRGGAGL